MHCTAMQVRFLISPSGQHGSGRRDTCHQPPFLGWQCSVATHLAMRLLLIWSPCRPFAIRVVMVQKAGASGEAVRGIVQASSCNSWRQAAYTATTSSTNRCPQQQAAKCAGNSDVFRVQRQQEQYQPNRAGSFLNFDLFLPWARDSNWSGQIDQ